MIGRVACGHPCILLIIIYLFLFCPSKLVSSSSMNQLLLLCCPIDAAGSLFFLIKKRIYHLYSVRFLQLAAISGGSIVEGGRVIAWQCAAYCGCVLVIRVAGSLGGGSSKSRSGSREELSSGDKCRVCRII